MSEIRLFLGAVEEHHCEPAILVQTRKRSRTAPVGRTTVARVKGLAGMVDPDLCVGVVAEPKMEDRFLVAPFAPAIVGGGAHGDCTRLVMVEPHQAFPTLGETPFLGAVAHVVGDGCKAGRHIETVVADQKRELGQGVDTASIVAATPEQASNAGKFQRARRPQRVLVGTSLGAGEDAVVGRARDDFEEPEDGHARPRAHVAIGRQRISAVSPAKSIGK